MDYFLGVDIGSITTKVVLLSYDKEKVEILDYKITKTGVDGNNSAKRLIEDILREKNIYDYEVKGITATGYGRIRVDFTSFTKTEISCHGKGVNFVFPSARTILDIGGQDSKAIRIGSKGEVLDFAMNDKCAAGTGRFLEVMSKVLEEDLENFGKIHMTTKDMVEITNICTVFAESEIITLLSEGYNKNSIIKGLNYSIGKRVISLLKRVGIERDVVMTGGVAKNEGVKKAIEDLLGFEIFIPFEPQIIGALGAGLFAIENYKS
ncbi:MAG: acyl-CoA dehydratase activase [Dictyoglomus sp.]|nr:acyl-CoA dehydratase activase [Dictyoglomus sp.]MCX7942854.1 acyl-CoA dehydratase activase [Dictyoglomaceae bacterium]MDW8189082.1 acyl-CoA dehydratase activase [Dictyoglomus sp.]